ncbi:transglycosylase SLT domain-containing protein [Dankookia sp. P2]|uniref:transglycosylase SLT domain-containing protein n=1 Tax=Dankookia sp. P2 TaxID=3423955 RepID=UPI003D6705DC
MTPPCMAPEAAAARAGKVQPGQHAQAGKPQATRSASPRRAQVAARPARQASRQGPAKAPRQALAEDIPGVRRVVVNALDGAIRSTGIEPTLLAALAWQESRFDPRARNGRSTARGLMQFTEATWLEAVRDHGPQHGLQYEAAVLSTNPASGSITTRHPRTRSRILELRDNPRYAAALAAARINRARIALQQSLGRTVGPADLYFVHLLGPAGRNGFSPGWTARLASPPSISSPPTAWR